MDAALGEECDEGSNMPSATCVDCVVPSANPTAAPSSAPTECICEASATYDVATGAVTVDFDMCDNEPLKSDFVAIYPCDAVDLVVADQNWWDNTVCRQFPASCGGFQYGYEEGQVYGK